MELQDLRQQIDAIDAQLIDLFKARMAISADIGAYKKENGLPIFVPIREHEKLLDVANRAGTDMAPYVQRLYSTIFELSRDYQTRLLSEVE